jgi:monoamine oxidase
MNAGPARIPQRLPEAEETCRAMKPYRPAGRVSFADDRPSCADAWQHGVSTSARRVVTALHARVPPS